MQGALRGKRMDRGVLIVVALIALGLHSQGLASHLHRVIQAGRWNDLGVVILGVAGVGIAASMRLGGWRGLKRGLGAGWGYGLLLLACALTALGYWMQDWRLVWMGSGWMLATVIGELFGLGVGAVVRMGLLLGFVPLLPWGIEWRVHEVGQRLASWFAGVLLDMARVFYYWRGNVIGLVDKDVLGNEQGAGLRWFGPVILTVFSYGFLRRYSLVRMIYLLAVGGGWLVVIQGGMIAYYFWEQVGKPGSGLEESLGWFDGVGVASVLFLVWSSDQFYFAFTYREAEESQGDEPFKSGGGGSQWWGGSKKGGLWGLVIGTVLYGLIGCWIWVAPGRFSTLAEFGGGVGTSRAFEGLPRQVGEWQFKEVEGGSFERFVPVFSQVDRFKQGEWELTRTGEMQGVQRVGEASISEEAYSVRFRMDGAWYDKPWGGWLWRWYGWRIFEEGREGELQYWSMSRTIAEEGFVVSGWGGPTGLGARGQYSLEIRGVRPISKEMQREMIALYGAIQGAMDTVVEEGGSR